MFGTFTTDDGRSSRQASEVAGRLQAIVNRARQVDEHMAGLASDSREQSQDLEQISTTVASLDQVTHGNAATAEQSASAATELSSQADALVHAVTEVPKELSAFLCLCHLESSVLTDGHPWRRQR
jgi:methyl-accepting chemotaxis protein